MAKKTSQPGTIHLRIVDVMKRFPEGISATQIRRELKNEGASPGDLNHLGRRIAELDEWFVIEKVTAQQASEGKERRLMEESTRIGLGLRAQVLYTAHGCCQLCRRTIETHAITLVVAHKEPSDRGATNDCEDLWAICERCNGARTVTLHRAEGAGARPRFGGCQMSVIGREHHNEL
jgi:hypothetical protein